MQAARLGCGLGRAAALAETNLSPISQAGLSQAPLFLPASSASPFSALPRPAPAPEDRGGRRGGVVNLPDGPGPREGAGWGQDRVLIEAKGVAPSYLGGWLKVVASLQSRA